MWQSKLSMDRPQRAAVKQATALAPMATIAIAMQENEMSFALELRGVISGTNAQRLADFLAAAAHLPALCWRVQMRELVLLSGRGLQSLVQFAQHLRQHGGRLEITGISESIYATLCDLNLIQAFGWVD